MYTTTSVIESNLKSSPKERWGRNERALLTLKKLQKLGNEPTREQLIDLASFSGWGSLAPVFKLDPQGWERDAQSRLKELLGETGYKDAAALTLNAHYTDPAIIRAIWNVIHKTEFKNGRILEPACGTGLFFGGMKPHYLEKSELYGVEIDPTSAAIAQYLYPRAVIHNLPFERCQLPHNYFDLAVSNVPFGSLGISDPEFDHLGLKIHNYFLAKLAKLVRIGGLIGIITSSYTLDAPGSERFREYLSKELKLVTAFRLPNTAFKEVANTQVTTDFLLFQKIEPVESAVDEPLPIWVTSKKVIIDPQNWQPDDKGEISEAYLNEYYHKEFNGRKHDLQYQKQINDNPGSIRHAELKDKIYAGIQHLFGSATVNQLYGDGFALLGDGRDNQSAIDAIKIDKCYVHDTLKNDVIPIPPELQHVKEMTFCLHNGRVYQRQRSNLVKIKNIEIERIESFWRLRNATIECINAQTNHEDITPFQQKLKQEYENFIYKWGKVNDKKNVNKLGSDPNYYLVRGLEKQKSSTVADIFHKRIAEYSVAPTTASNIYDAISLSLANKGKFDLSYIAQLLNNSTSEVIELLENDSLAYFNPITEKWELKEAYLSGNIVEKLDIASKHSLPRNVEALKASLPLPMLPNAASDIKYDCIEALGIKWDKLSPVKQETLFKKHIKAQPGAGWISSNYYEQFALEVMGVSRAKVRRVDTKDIACWVVSGYSRDTVEYGTGYLSSIEILQYVLNQQDPRVTLYDKDKKFDVKASNKATEEARNKANFLKKAFADWIWVDKKRSIELCIHYNKTVNVYVDRKYDGSYLTFPGMNPLIKLRPWQKDAVARIIQCGTTFVGHEVGFGKSYTLIAAIMECRRLGLAKRPVLVALNGTEQQLFNDWKKLYPTANVLILNNLNADNRKYFTAALASADFDGVILTHSQYFSLALSTEYQLEFLNREKAILQDYLEEVKRDDRGAAKQIQRTLRSIEHRIYKVVNSIRKDGHIDFERLLIDWLGIDEIQMFKNLSVITKMGYIKGILTNWSQRATDNYMKMLHVSGNALNSIIKNGGKTVGATGTIINNSLTEVFTWLRTFASRELDKIGASAFDKFMSYFGVVSSGAEISASGKYKVVTRFKSFCNLQPLRAICKQFLDIVNRHTHPEVAKQLEIPEAKYIDVVVQPSEAQLKFLSDAYQRATDIEDRKVEPDEDNYLWLTTDFNKCALTARLLGETSEALGSKLHECAWNVWQIWKASHHTKRTQLIFCDYSTPKPDKYNVYDYMKLLLTALGIPASQIEFIHNWDADSRPKLYKLIEQGKVRIVLGSTSKLGTGCNVHRRGIEFMHHLDAPWRPSDDKQRNGRGERQGNGELLGVSNKVKTITIIRYITERLDALRWQALATKQKFIEDFFNGDEDEIENCEEVVYSFNVVKSLAIGNPLLVEEANLRSGLNILLSQLNTHEQQQFSLSYETRKWQLILDNLISKVELVKEDISSIGGIPSILERTQIGDAISNNRKLVLAAKKQLTTLLGEYRNFSVYGEYDVYKKDVEIKLHLNAIYDFDTKINGIKVPLKVSNILNSIDELITLLPDYLIQLSREIDSVRVEIVRCQSLVNKQFDGMEQIDTVQHRLADIEAILKEHDSAVSSGAESNEESEELNESNESNDTVDDDKGEFWELRDKSVGATTLSQEVVNMLLKRPVEGVEWLTEYIQRNQSTSVAETIKVEAKVSTTPSTPTPALTPLTKTSTKQLSLFDL
ncbi:hypothetical protein NIES4071_102080 (plasmid) [Calothrix sp. NIES-4071]|nr:hypothetical protein NIES4071_102080 [Calothrix sp. NIES-4071]BAZ64589.1 hypothetical protein NIES4105_103220 [Calothrix sp. NIES-4105]